MGSGIFDVIFSFGAGLAVVDFHAGRTKEVT